METEIILLIWTALVIEIIKQTSIPDNLLPILSCIIGCIIMIIINGFNDIWVNGANGIIVGLGATGGHQVIKQFQKGGDKDE